MKIKPAAIPKRSKPSGFWFNTLTEFLAGNEDCVELIPGPQEYKNLRSRQSSVSAAIHRYNLAITTANMDGKLYIIKKVRGNSDEG